MIASCRHGKEEDEVMGVSFKKELIIDRKQVSTILIDNLDCFKFNCGLLILWYKLLLVSQLKYALMLLIKFVQNTTIRKCCFCINI